MEKKYTKLIELAFDSFQESKIVQEKKLIFAKNSNNSLSIMPASEITSENSEVIVEELKVMINQEIENEEQTYEKVKEALIKYQEIFYLQMQKKLAELNNLVLNHQILICKNFFEDFSNGMINEEEELIERVKILLASIGKNKQNFFETIENKMNNFLRHFDFIFYESNPFPQPKQIVSYKEFKNALPSSLCFSGRGITLDPNNSSRAILISNDGTACYRESDGNVLWTKSFAQIAGNSDDNCVTFHPRLPYFAYTTVNGSEVIIVNNDGIVHEKVSNISSPSRMRWISHSLLAVVTNGSLQLINFDQNLKSPSSDSWVGKHLSRIRTICPISNDIIAFGDANGSLVYVEYLESKKTDIKECCIHLHSDFLNMISLSKKKDKIATASDDYHVSVVRNWDHHIMWKRKHFQGYVKGVFWSPGDVYILAHSGSCELKILSSDKGEVVIDYTFQYEIHCADVSWERCEIWVGKGNGDIEVLKIKCDEKKEQSINKNISKKKNLKGVQKKTYNYY